MVQIFLRQQPFLRIFVVVYFMDFTLICQTIPQQRINRICEVVETHAQCTTLMMCRFFESKDGDELICFDGLHRRFHGISLALFSLSVWRLNGEYFVKKDTRIYWKRINWGFITYSKQLEQNWSEPYSLSNRLLLFCYICFVPTCKLVQTFAITPRRLHNPFNVIQWLMRMWTHELMFNSYVCTSFCAAGRFISYPFCFTNRRRRRGKKHTRAQWKRQMGISLIFMAAVGNSWIECLRDFKCINLAGSQCRMSTIVCNSLAPLFGIPKWTLSPQ